MRRFRANLIPLGIALAVGFCSVFYSWYGFVRSDRLQDSLFQNLELRTLDYKFALRDNVNVPTRVVIAAGDERAIERFGRWGNWDRRVFAKVIDTAMGLGADVVAFDMVFSDLAGIDHQNTAELAKAFAEQKSLEDLQKTFSKATAGDAALEKMFDQWTNNIVQGFVANPEPEKQNTGNAIENFGESLEPFVLEEFGYGLLEQRGEVGEAIITTIDPVVGKSAADLLNVRPAKGEITLPLQPFLDAASNMGFFSMYPDADGVFRRLPLVYRYGNVFLRSLAFSSAELHFGGTGFLVSHEELIPKGLHQIGFPKPDGENVFVPVDKDGSLRINYYGGSIFPEISMADIYCYKNEECEPLQRNRIDPGAFKNQVVLVAVTAIGTFDQRVTPLDDFAPGFEIHAAAIQNMIDGTALRRDPEIVKKELLLILGLALFLGVMLHRTSILVGTALVLSLVAAWFLVDFYILFSHNLWFHQLGIQLQLGFTWAGVSLYGYITEGREKAQLKREFGTVLAPQVVEQLLQNPDMAGLGGAERELTVLFSDIRGFTGISEKMTPAELTAFLNEYLTPMTDILIRQQGTLDKYMGDAIMAFWGAPTIQPNHALRACRAALQMIRELSNLQKKWISEGKPPIDVGIGLNTGMMRVGFMGSERMRNYTLLGDNVNLGSRLEGVNKEYGTNILISVDTFRAVGEHLYARELDDIRVKGRTEPVTIYELRGEGTPSMPEQEFLAAFETARKDYRAQRFAAAKSAFESALEMSPSDRPCKLYIGRCEQFIQTPPSEDWDGVYEMKTK